MHYTIPMLSIILFIAPLFIEIKKSREGCSIDDIICDNLYTYAELSKNIQRLATLIQQHTIRRPIIITKI